MKSAIIFFILVASVVSTLIYPNRPEGDGWRLLKTSESHAEWVHEMSINNLLFGSPTRYKTPSAKVKTAILVDRRYKDVTADWENGVRVSEPVSIYKKSIPNYPKPNPQAHPEVTAFLTQASPSTLKSNLEEMSSIYTRYYKSSYSRQASEFIKTKLEAIINQAGLTDVKVDYIDNVGYDQPNVRVIVPATENSDNADEIAIMGAHLDSICSEGCSGKDARSPGGDDDASGSVTVLEAFRLIIENKWRGSRTMHFLWFAAEEPGLLGSATVAKLYKKENRNVHGMLQFDMTGYHSGGQKMTTLTDPNSKMADYLYKISKAYVPETPIIKDSCGYACSDQWSFDEEGFPAGMYIEDEPTDPYVHSKKDTPDKLDFDGMAQFVKLGVAFITEIAR